MVLAVQFAQFGPPDVLALVEVDEPQPGPGQVRVLFRAGGINPADSKYRRGASAGSVQLPSRLGRDLAGVVDELGPGTTRFRVGDAVFGAVDNNALAEFIVADEARFTAKPHDLPWTVAGALTVTGQTAHDELESQNVSATDTVLISAAAGGVGCIAAQLALRTGATVIGTASEDNHQFLEGLGVIPVSYGPGLADRIRSASPTAVTVTFDHHGAETVEAALELGVPKARINSISGVAGQFGVAGVGRGPASPETMRRLADLVVAGELEFPIEATYSMADIVAAFEHLDRGHVRGKIVITLD